jgi:hypothetical protein
VDDTPAACLFLFAWRRFADELRLLGDAIANLQNATRREDIFDTLHFQVGRRWAMI